MANVYVYSGAAGAGTGADWANAYTTLAAACTAKAAGDVFYVAHDHAETQASAMTITSKGTVSNPCFFYCVNRAGSVPPVSADLRTTGAIVTTGANGITLNGYGYWNGLVFNCGTGAVNANLTLSSFGLILDRCALNIVATGLTSQIANGSTNNKVTLNNTTLSFGAVDQKISFAGMTYWYNTANAIQGATVPTILIDSSTGGNAFFEGIDLSALGSGKTIISAPSSRSNIILKDCKIGASVTIAATPTFDFGGGVKVIRCDSGDTNYRTENYTYFGTQTTETTIVRTGGATDGTTPISWKIVTTANSKWQFPFECLPISVWNETTGSAITVTIQGIWGGGAVPLNDEIWIDVEYLGTSGFPLASKATSTKADGLATGTSIAAGSGTWGGSTTKFAMSATFTPQEKGPITIYVKAAKVSSTFYVDPKPVVT